MTRPVPRRSFAGWMAATNDVTRTFLSAGQIPGLINMAGGLPEPVTWPVAELATLAASAVADHPADALAYAPIEGLPALRELIAGRFAAPGLHLNRENVLITTGGMQSLDLIGKVLLEEGGLIAAQSPAYLGALDAWKPRRPNYRPMRMEHYHPKIALSEITNALRRQSETLIGQKLASDEAAIESYARSLETLEADPDRRDLAWQLGLDAEVIDAGRRRRELRNIFDLIRC